MESGKLPEKPSDGPIKAANRSTLELRKLLREAIESEIEQMPKYLSEIQDKRVRIELLIRLMPFVFPKMQSIDLVAAQEKDPMDWGQFSGFK